MGKKVSEMTVKEHEHKQQYDAWYYRTTLRPKRKKIRKLYIQDSKIPKEIKAYIAGFIDGEGCVCLRRNYRKNQKTAEISTMFAVYNTNKVPLQLIARYFPGQIYSRQRGHYRRSYSFVFSSKFESLYNTCYQLIPFLIIKKRHLEILLKYCEQRIIASSKFGYKYNGNSYTKEDWDLVNQMKKLKE